MATHPTAFISYSRDDEDHKAWVRELATQLRTDGVDVRLDHWHAVPGDQLLEFMEREIRNNDFVLIICTLRYKAKSDGRIGGVGYEGDIMTGEVLTKQNDRKFIPVLARGTWEESAPSWLIGKRYIDLSAAARYARGYPDLLATILGMGPKLPPLGPVPPGYKSSAHRPPGAPVSSAPRGVNLWGGMSSWPRDNQKGIELYKLLAKIKYDEIHPHARCRVRSYRNRSSCRSYPVTVFFG
jgi:TIR domain-containing protein